MHAMSDKTKEFLSIAIPAVLESLVSVIITTIDTRMISVLGNTAISAVSFTNQPKLFFFAIFFALGTTVSIFVSQANGKGDAKEGNYYFHVILKITILLSLILGALLWIFAEPVMRLCNRQADSFDMSAAFFRIVMGFMLFQTVSVILNAALRGIGKTEVTLISNITMGVVDIVFNYLLIEGHGGFPRLEVRGDAIATVLGTAAACAVSMIAIVRQTDFLSMKGFFKQRIFQNRAGLRSIRDKAGNLIFENLFMRIGFLVSSVVVSMLSSDETAVYSVAMILLNYTFAFGDGIQSGVVALCGKSYGAKDRDSFRQYNTVAVRFGIVSAVLLSVVYIAFAKPYYSRFFSDQASIDRGTQFSCIAAVLTIVQILRITETGVMRSMGEVRDPRRIATVCVLIVNPFATYLLAVEAHFGVYGVWQGSLISQGLWLILSIICCRKIRTGVWQC